MNDETRPSPPVRPLPRTTNFDRQTPPPPRSVKIADNKIWMGFQMGIGFMLALLIAGPFVAIIAAIFWVLVFWRLGG